MTLRLSLALLVCSTGLITGVTGCAQLNEPGGGITTGSIILPSLPSLPDASSLLPSGSTILPSPSIGSTQRRPERIGGNLYRVAANDRNIDDPIQRENYALLRAAETAKAAGASHFIVVNASQQGAPAGLAAGASGDISTLIRVLQLEPGAEPPIGAVAADEIIHFFGPAFERKSEPSAPASPPPAAPPA